MCFPSVSTFGVDLAQKGRPRVYGSYMTHIAPKIWTLKKDTTFARVGW